MSRRLIDGLTLEPWGPVLLTTASLILLAVLVMTRTQSSLGGPLLLAWSCCCWAYR